MPPRLVHIEDEGAGGRVADRVVALDVRPVPGKHRGPVDEPHEGEQGEIEPPERDLQKERPLSDGHGAFEGGWRRAPPPGEALLRQGLDYLG
jgi:hypothetical protein